ncbi:MAG TPA: lytic murein transglycosylase [Psychromonas hadalis]|nr:lytic murein transglycosylase [Psychromonas hadalis]
MKKITLSLLAVFMVFTAVASVSSTHLSLAEQRALYVQTVELQSQKEWDEANKQAALIPDYPLTYRLEYRYLEANFSKVSQKTVEDFIIKEVNYTASDDLQRAYLFYLGRNKKWQALLDFYPKLPNNLALKCFYAQANLELKNEEAAWKTVQSVWRTGQSLPASCEPVLNHYLSQSKIDKDMIWKRFQLAFNARNSSLMNYLITLMDKKNETANVAVAKQLIQLSKKPEEIISAPLFNQSSGNSGQLTLLIKRLARQDLQLGFEAYDYFNKKQRLSKKQKTNIKRYFAARIVQGPKLKYFTWLDKTIPKLNSLSLVEQRLRYAIRVNNWNDIEHWLTQFPKKRRANKIWTYWDARVLERKGLIKEANESYKKLATERTYYGFLSAQKLNINYQFNAETISENVNVGEQYSDFLSQIKEMNFHKNHQLIKREWDRMLRKSNKNLKRQFGLYAQQQGWAHLSVLASISSKSWSALNIRFPEVDPALFSKNAKQYQLERTYIYAIARQESSFDEAASSPVGGKGYMQLMPYTAKDTAKMIGMKNYSKSEQLNDGNINVQLGTAYIDMLIDRYDGNRVLATAAYNAGPHRIDNWKENKKGRNDALTMDSWIEAIPYKETRRYVKNVLAYNVIYQHILDKPLELLNEKERNARY